MWRALRSPALLISLGVVTFLAVAGAAAAFYLRVEDDNAAAQAIMAAALRGLGTSRAEAAFNRYAALARPRFGYHGGTELAAAIVQIGSITDAARDNLGTAAPGYAEAVWNGDPEAAGTDLTRIFANDDAVVDVVGKLAADGALDERQLDGLTGALGDLRRRSILAAALCRKYAAPENCRAETPEIGHAQAPAAAKEARAARATPRLDPSGVRGERPGPISKPTVAPGLGPASGRR